MTTILMYHQVAEISRDVDPLGLAVHPTQFDRHMSYLARNGYVCLTLPEAVQQFRKGGKTPARSFVLTFDDGYQDFYNNACPVLEKYGFSATIFIVAGRIGKLSNWWGQDGARSGLLMSLTEARDLVKRGYVLGSHSLSHPFLNALDEQSALSEIQQSRILLQDQLETQVDYFSYPFSETDPRIEALVESAGYLAACAGNSGPWGIFHLWRVPCLREDTLFSFSLKISGWYDKRTALRESGPGLFLRRSLRMIRCQMGIHHPGRQDAVKNGTNHVPEREQ